MASYVYVDMATKNQDNNIRQINISVVHVEVGRICGRHSPVMITIMSGAHGGFVVSLFHSASIFNWRWHLRLTSNTIEKLSFLLAGHVVTRAAEDAIFVPPNATRVTQRSPNRNVSPEGGVGASTADALFRGFLLGLWFAGVRHL
eukprot:m.118899 g.118899  ORF g.118899 m.118899 type:complete len:145 (+) comp28709_c0_seq1:51-485(+)